MTYPLLPAPRARGNPNRATPPAVIHLPAWCPPGLGAAVYPHKPIIITTVYGSVAVDGYADIGAELARLMRVPVTIIERTAVEDWRPHDRRE